MKATFKEWGAVAIYVLGMTFAAGAFYQRMNVVESEIQELRNDVKEIKSLIWRVHNNGGSNPNSDHR